MANEDLLVNLELETQGFEDDMEKVNDAISESNVQNAQLTKELLKLEKSFSKVKKEVKSVDRELTTNQMLLGKTVQVTVDAAEAVGALSAAYSSVANAVKDVTTAFSGLVSAASSVFNIFNTLTDPSFLIRLSKLVLLLSTLARVKGLSQIAAQLRQVATSLQSGALFFAQFREEGELTIDSLVRRAALLNQLFDSIKTTALVTATLAAVGVVTGLNDVLREFGVVTKSISGPLNNMPALIRSVLEPFKLFMANVSAVSVATLKMVDSFGAMVTGGKTFSRFVADLPVSAKNFQDAADGFARALSGLADSIPPLVASIANRLRKIDVTVRLMAKAGRDVFRAFTSELAREATRATGLLGTFEALGSSLGARFGKGLRAFGKSELVGVVNEFSGGVVGETIKSLGRLQQSVSKTTKAIAKPFVEMFRVIGASDQFLAITKTFSQLQKSLVGLGAAFDNVVPIANTTAVLNRSLGVLSKGLTVVGKDIQAFGRTFSMVGKDIGKVLIGSLGALATALDFVILPIIQMNRVALQLASVGFKQIFFSFVDMGRALVKEVIPSFRMYLRILRNSGPGIIPAVKNTGLFIKSLGQLRQGLVLLQPAMLVFLNNLSYLLFPLELITFHLIQITGAFGIAAKKSQRLAKALVLLRESLSITLKSAGEVAKSFTQVVRVMGSEAVRAVLAFSKTLTSSLEPSLFVVGRSMVLVSRSISTLTVQIASLAKFTGILAFDHVTGALGSFSKRIQETFPLIENLVFNMKQIGLIFLPIAEELVGAGKEILTIFAQMGSFIPTILDDIAFAFKGAFTADSFKKFTEQFSGSMRSAFTLARGVAAIGMKEISLVVADRGATLSGIFGQFGKAISQTWRTTMDDALIATLRFEVFTKNSFKTVLDSAGRGVQAFSRGFVTGFTSPIRAAAEISSTFGKVVQGILPSLLSLTEVSNVVGTPVLAIGSAALQSESALVKLGATALIVAGVAMVGLAASMLFLLKTIGGFLESIGNKMIAAMTRFEEKFRKAQIVVKAFEFTLVNFGKTLGTAVVGSLSFWNKRVQELAESTQFSTNAIRKSIQLLVAESQVVGLTLAQSSQLLDRAADLAASKGAKLSDVVDSLIGGITGQATAVRALGINLTEHAIEHSQFTAAIEEEGIAVGENVRTMIRFNEVMHQTTPLAGFAAAALSTVNGSSVQLEKTLVSIEETLGAQSAATVAYLTTLTNLGKAFLDLPESILGAMGVVIDFGGVFLKVTGILLQYALIVSSLTALYHILNAVIVNSAFVQTQLTTVVGFASSALGVQTVAVTSLNTALIASITLIKGALIKALASFGTVLLTVAKQVAVLTGAILLNPLFWKIAIIVGGVVALYKAIKQLRSELSQLQPRMAKAGKETGQIAKAMDQLKKTFMAIGNAFVNLVKLMLIGLLKIVRLVQFATTGYQLMWAKITGNTKAMKKLREEGLQALEDLDELGAASSASWAAVASTFEDTALAAEKAAEQAKKIDIGKIVTDLQQRASGLEMSFSIDLITDPFDKSLAKVLRSSKAAASKTAVAFKVLEEVLGKEVAARFKDTLGSSPTGMVTLLNASIGRLKDLGKETGEVEKALGDLQSAVSDSESAQIELSDLRISTSKQLRELQKQATQSILREQGQVVEAVRLENAERLKIFEGQAKQLLELAKSNAVRKATVKLIRETREALKGQNEEALKAAQASVSDKEKAAAKEQLRTIQAIRKEFMRLDKQVLKDKGDQIGVASLQLGIRMNEIDALEQSLSKQKEFTDGAGKLKAMYAGVLQEARDLANLKFKEMQPFTVGDLVDTLKEAYQKSKQFTKDLFSGDLFKGLKDFKFPTVAEMKALGENLWGGLKDTLNNIDLKTVGSGIMKGLKGGLGFIMDMFNPENINKLADFLGEFLQKLPEALSQALQKLDRVLISFIEAFPELVSNILDALPMLIKSILDQIPALIDALVLALNSLFEKLPGILAMILDALPGIITQIMDVLPDLILRLFEATGIIVAQVIKALPGVLVALIDGIPAIVEALVEGFIAATGDIVTAFVDFLIAGGLEKIVVALIRAVPRIVVALVRGIVRGLQRAFGSLFNGIEAPKALTALPDKFAKGIKNLAKKATEESSKLFKVLALDDPAKGLGASASPGAAFQDMFLEVGQEITGMWQGFLSALKRAWMWVWEKVIIPISELLTKIWSWVYNTLFKPWVAGLKAVFKWIVDNVVEPLTAGLEVIFDGIKETWDGMMVVLDGIVATLKGIFDTLKTTVDEAFAALFDFFNTLKTTVDEAFAAIFDFFKNILKGDIDAAFSGALASVKDIGKTIWEGFKEALDSGMSVFTDVGTAIFSGLETALGGIGDVLKDSLSGLGKVFEDALKGINPKNLFAKVFSTKGASGKPGTVEQILGINVPFIKFAGGGILPGNAVAPGDSELNDRILALLSPGEAVIPRTKMQNPAIAGIVRNILKGDFNIPNFALGGELGRILEATGLGSLDLGTVDFSQVDPRSINFSDLSTENLGKVATRVTTDAWRGLQDGLRAVEKMLEDLGLTGVIQAMWDRVMNEVSKAMKNMLVANKMGEGTDAALKQHPFAEAFAQLAPTMVGTAAIETYHRGGLVPGYAMGGEVPAVLQRGEYVINRQAVKSLGIGSLNQLNRGGAPVNQSFNFDIALDVRSDGLPDENFVRQRMIPAVKRELKDASMRGEFLISNRGIRDT